MLRRITSCQKRLSPSRFVTSFLDGDGWEGQKEHLLPISGYTHELYIHNKLIGAGVGIKPVNDIVRHGEDERI